MLLRTEHGVRWLPVATLVLVVGVGGYFGVRRLFLNDTATPVALDDVLGDFRDDTRAAAPISTTPVLSAPVVSAPVPAGPVASTSVATAPGTIRPGTTGPAETIPVASRPVLPVPGVYRYTTSGKEGIDALGGTEHVYPAETTITVTEDGCGVRLRWDLLAERYEEWHVCIVDARVTLAPDGVQFHEFYGQSRTDIAVCRHAVVLAPAPAPGTQTARDCTLADEPWQPVWTFTGSGTTEIDGADVDTETFEATIEVDDPEYWEHTTVTWTMSTSGLPVTVDWNASSRNPSPVGGTVYTETLTARLVSTTPLR
jgi:hypothetical protein